MCDNGQMGDQDNRQIWAYPKITKKKKKNGHSGDKAIASEKKGQCGPGQSEETFLLCEVGRIWAVSEGQVKLE